MIQRFQFNNLRFQCCTVNHPQGWPKFISNAFVATQDWSSLIHVYLGPFSMKTVLAEGNQSLFMRVPWLSGLPR